MCIIDRLFYFFRFLRFVLFVIFDFFLSMLFYRMNILYLGKVFFGRFVVFCESEVEVRV